MMSDKIGYFDYQGGTKNRYRDSQGNVYHNHLGPAMNSLGSFFGVKDAIKNSADAQNARLKKASTAKRTPAKSSEPIPRPSQPDGEPTVYAQHAGTEYRQTTDGRDVYVTNGVTYDRATGQQVARPHGSDETGIHDGAFSYTPEDKYDAYKGTSIRNQDNQSIYEGTQVWKVPDSTGGSGGDASNSGRGDFRVSPTGVAQKGTNMSRSFNDLLATTNTSGYQPYSSSQLPTTQGNPFEGTAPKTDSFNPAAPGVTGATYDNYGADGGVAAASSNDRSQFTPMTGKEERIEGGSDRRKGGSLADALADTAGINSYMSKFSSGDQERLANRAFLDTEGSMEGLRAKEAVNGVVYAGGQHYIDGGEGNPAQRLEDPQNARDIASGKAKAQDFLKSKIDTTINTQTDTAAKAQDPLSAAGSAVKSAFAAGAQTDFALNNQSGAPQSGVGPVVPTDQIPKDLSGAAGKKYLADLDAGRLFK